MKQFALHMFYNLYISHKYTDTYPLLFRESNLCIARI